MGPTPRTLAYPAKLESRYDRLYGTAAIDPDDVGAVGRYIDKANVSRTLIEHWNGASREMSVDVQSGLWAAGFDLNLRSYAHDTTRVL